MPAKTESNGIKMSSDAPEEEKYYTDAAEYWANIAPTVDGMLGGFGNISGLGISL